ncbi:MAG: hypothetical protein IPK65_01045 [Gammaproteobacteria bacterium]|nr:hypothetical protein [Gammaproteobacteria bacterium]
MPVARPELRRMVAGVAAALWTLPSFAAVELLDLSGSVGYALRTLRGSSSLDTTSNQLRGVVNARSYIWQPWFATADASLRFTQDSSDYDGGASSTDTSIVSGDLDLNVLSQSRTPFSLTYNASDSRVDVISLASPLTTLGSQEFQTRRLALKQSYFTEQGDRFQARYDRNKWSARDGDSYEDYLFGVEMDLRRQRHTLTAKTSYQETERNVLDQNTETTVFNVDHFYHPGRALRVDSMASYYGTDTASDQPLNSTNQGDSSDERQRRGFGDRLQGAHGGAVPVGHPRDILPLHLPVAYLGLVPEPGHRGGGRADGAGQARPRRPAAVADGGPRHVPPQPDPGGERKPAGGRRRRHERTA